jgi:hypothetical protein
MLRQQSAIMKDATSATLAGFSELLEQIRQRAGLKEKKPGIFYRKSKSFLHFHEPDGIIRRFAGGRRFPTLPGEHSA